MLNELSAREICEAFRLWLRCNGGYYLFQTKSGPTTLDVPFTLKYTPDGTKAYLKVKYAQLPRGFRPQELLKTVDMLGNMLECPVSLRLSVVIFIIQIDLVAVNPVLTDQAVFQEAMA